MWAGILFGLAAVFKHDVAGYMVLGTALTFFLVSKLDSTTCEGLLRPLAATARLAVGSLIVLLPVSCFIALVAGADSGKDLFVLPATDFRAVRTENYPGLRPELTVFKAWVDDY